MSVPDVIASDIIGVVIMARHGDRQSFYQDPNSYTGTETSITPLGEKQEFQLGSLIRSTYLDNTSPLYVQGISPATALFVSDQVAVRADGGDEGGVIFDSSVALLQGLWPTTPLQSIILANGTNITSPLGGYQYIPIESVNPNEDVSLEGFTDCNTLTARTTQFYQSPAFLAKANQSAAFLSELAPFLDGRAVTLQNMWNIYDYMNVNSIHNATFAGLLPPTFLAQARDLANYHEYNIFTDPDFSGIGNIAGETLLPSVLTALQRIVNTTDPLRLHYTALSYKPLLSLFNMTGVVENGELPAAIVNYAAAVVMEVHQPFAGGEPTLTFKFKNGTDDVAFNTYNLTFGNWDGRVDGALPVSTFLSAFEPAAINTTSEWCKVCQNSVDRGCAALVAAQPTTVTVGAHDRISPVGAGFLGAGLTLAVFSAALAVSLFLGVLSYGRLARRHSQKGTRHTGGEVELGSEVNSVHKAAA